MVASLYEEYYNLIVNINFANLVHKKHNFVYHVPALVLTLIKFSEAIVINLLIFIYGTLTVCALVVILPQT